MLIHRRGLLLSAAALGVTPAVARTRHAVSAPARAAARANAKAAAQAATTTPATPADTPLGPLDISAQWAIIKDYDTGATLLKKNADQEMPPSSMTKLMTVYLTFERLAEGRLKLTDELPVSEKAWRTGGSRMFVTVGTRVPVEDLIRGIFVDSGNDAATVLAQAIGGSEAQFVNMMNAKAKQFGMTHTHYMNCTGLPDPGHYMSARDIATLAEHIIRDFPQYYHYASEKTFVYDNISQQNRNPMVQRGTADGLKTGHTEAGGYGLVSSSDRNGRRLILVLNGMATNRERIEDSERLMDWAFFNFEDVTLYRAADVVENVPVWLGTAPTVPVVTGKDIVVTMPRNWRQKASVNVSYNAPIAAPVSKGTTVGQLSITGQGVPNLTVPLQAGADVARLGLPGRAMAVLTQYISHI